MLQKQICVFIIWSTLFISIKGEINTSQISPVWDHIKKARYFLFNQPDSACHTLQEATLKYSGNKKDTLYAEILLLSGINASIKGNTKQAFEYVKASNEIYTASNNKKGIAESLLNMGEILYDWGQYDQAFKYFNQVFMIAKQNALLSIEMQSLNCMGKYYHSLGDFHLSFNYYSRSLKLAQASQDTVEIISIKNKIGKHFETLGNYPKALECYLYAEKLVQVTHNLIQNATTYNSLGNIYHLFKEYPKAIVFHHKALLTRRKMQYEEGVAKSLNNLGEVLLDVNKLDSASSCFTQSLNICQKIGNTKGSVKSLQNLGIVFQHQLKDELATNKFREALKLAEQIGYDKGVLNAYFSLSEICKRNNKLNQAGLYCQKGLQIAIKENVRSSISDFYNSLSEIYSQKGNYKEALHFYKEHTRVANEMVNLESNNRISELKAQYKVSLQNRENEVLKKANEIKELMIKRKNLFILFSTIILALLATLVVILYNKFLQKKRANIKLTKLNEDITAKNNELDLLNKKLHKVKEQQVKLFSIISHELRNPIFWFRNLIQILTSRIDTLDKEMITKSLNSLNESATNTFHLMDNLLHWSRSQLGNIKYKPEPVEIGVLIQESIDLMSHYAFHKNISIQYIHHADLVVFVDKVMIQTVVRNLLSNAVKFTRAKGIIEISFKSKGKNAFIQIKDNGVGMNKKNLKSILNSSGTSYILGTHNETGSGLGLALSKEFIEINGGKLIAQSESGVGSVFMFELPMKNTRNKVCSAKKKNGVP